MLLEYRSLDEASASTTRPWSPATDLPGIVAWWDANKGVALSSGNVSTWTDQIGGVVASPGNNTTGFSATARNGKPGILFNSNNSLNFTPPSTFPSGSATGVVALSGYANSTTTSGRWAFAYGNGNYGTRYVFTGDGSSQGYATIGTGGSGSNDYTVESWVSNDRFIVGQFGPGTSLIANVDGNNAESNVPSTTTNTTLAAGCIGKWPDYGDFFDGSISQIIIVNRALSTTTRQSLEGWESWYTGKAGSNLPANHPYKSAAPTVSTVTTTTQSTVRLATPLDASVRPIYYFDPSDTTTIIKDGNGRNDYRLDISGNNVIASCPDSNTSYRSTTITNGIGGLNSISYYGGYSYDQAQLSLQTKTLTAFAVVQPHQNSGYARFMSFNAASGSDWNNTQSFDVEQNGQQSSILVYLQHNQTQSPQQYLLSDDTPIIVEVVFDGTNGTLYINGNSCGSFTSSDEFNIAKSTFGQSGQNDGGWGGMQGGQLLFGSALSAADRALVRGSLAWKWDGGSAGPLVNALPTSDPYKNAPPTMPIVASTVTSRPWTPNDLPTGTLAAWHDADDPSTVVLGSGNSVNIWRDKSGNGIDLFANYGGPNYSTAGRNGRPAMLFSNNGWLATNGATVTNFPVSASSSSIIAIANLQGTSHNVGAVAGYGGGGSNAYRFLGTLDANHVGLSITDTDKTCTEILLNKDRLLAAEFDNGYIGVYVDGVGTRESFSVPTMITPTPSQYCIGNHAVFSSQCAWTGPIQEVFVVRGILATSDRQKLEGYLAWKWGLQANLPTSHPYAAVMPTVQTGKRLWDPLKDQIGLVALFDGTDQTSFTFAQNGNIATWTDKKSDIVATVNSSGSATYNAYARNNAGGVQISSTYFTFDASNFPAGQVDRTFLASGYSNSGPSYDNTILMYGAQSQGQAIKIWSEVNDSSCSPSLDIWGGNTQSNPNVNWTGGNDQSTIWTITNSGANTTVYWKGGRYNQTVYQAANTAANTTGYIGIDARTYTGQWVGTLQVIAVLNHAATLDERTLLEGWESWHTGKNGSNLPSYHAYKNSPPTVSVNAARLWMPTDLGSAVVEWWDAGFGVSKDTSNNVSSWSGRILGKSASTSSNYPTFSPTAVNNQPGLHFNGSSQSLTINNPTFVPTTDFAAAVSVTAEAASDKRYILGWGYLRNTFEGRGFVVNSQNLGFDSGYNGVGAPTNTVNNNVPFLDYYQYSFSANSGSLYQDGAYQNTDTHQYIPADNSAPFGIGYWPAYGNTWQGTIQQIVLCNRTLTTVERQNLEGWESWYTGKNGVNLASNHPFKFNPPRFGAAVNPDTLGHTAGTLANLSDVPKAWWDPSDLTTISPNNAKIAALYDKSGYNQTLTKSDSQTQPPIGSWPISKLPAIAFNGTSQYLDRGGSSNPLSVTGNTNTVMQVIAPNGGQAGCTFSLGSDAQSYGTGPNEGRAILYDNGSWVAGDDARGYSCYASDNSDWTPKIVTCTQNPSGAKLYINGTLVSNDTSSITAYNDANVIRLGDYQRPGPHCNAIIGETALWDVYLSDSDRQYAEGYMAWKWDGGVAGQLVSKLPSNHPYKNAAPQADTATNTRKWTPTDLTSVKLSGWYRMRDPNNKIPTGGDVYSGSSVTKWKDRSGLGNDLPVINASNASFNPNGLGNGVSTITTNGQPSGWFGQVNNVPTGRFGAFGVLAPNASQPNSGARIIATGNVAGGGSGPNDNTSPNCIPLTLSGSNATAIQGYYNSNSYTVNITGGLPLIAGCYNRGNNTVQGLSLNGSEVGSFATNYDETVANLGIGSNGQYQGSYIAAEHAEYVTFVGSLSIVEQIKLEGYLAWNNGQQALLPATHPYKYAAPTITTNKNVWTPDNLPYGSVKAWFNAKHSHTVTYTPDSNGNYLVYDWQDLAGSQRHASQVSASAAPIWDPSAAEIIFNGSQSLSTPLFPINAGKVRSVYVVGRSLNSNANGYGVFFGSENSGNAFGIDFNNPSDATIKTFTWGGGSYDLTIGPSVTNTTVVGFRYDGSTLSGLVNGSVHASSTIGIGTTPNYMMIGARTNQCGYAAISEIVVTGYITEADNYRLQGYLAWANGRENFLPSDHPYRYSVPTIDTANTRLWDPSDLGSLLATWFDANDASTITKTGNVVTQWSDKSVSSGARQNTYPRNAVQEGSNPAPSYSANAFQGMPGIVGNGSSQYLVIPQNGPIYNGTDGLSAMCVAVQNLGTNGQSNTGQAIMSSGAKNGSTASNDQGGAELRFINGTIDFISAYTTDLVNSPSIQLGPHVVGYDASSSSSIVYADGSATKSSSDPGLTSQVNELFRSVYATDFFNGAISEIVLTTRKLSVNQRQKLEGYLAWKWDGGIAGVLVGQLPPWHPYKLSPPVVSNYRLATPLDLPLIKPTYYFDPSNQENQVIDGSGNIQTRIDVSGNSLPAGSAESNHRSSPLASGIGGLPSMSYYGGQYDRVSVPSYVGKTLTAFVVARPDSTTGYARWMSFGSANHTYDWDNVQSFAIQRTNDSTNNGNNIQIQRNASSPSLPFQDKVPVILEVVFDGTNGKFCLNGGTPVTWASSDTFVIDRSFFGAGVAENDGFSGWQGSQLFYTQALTDAQRAYIRGCLAWKWDGGVAGPLVNALPSTDPYKNAPPTVLGSATLGSGWNPVDTDSALTYNSATSVVNNTNGGWYNVRSNTGYTSGRYYFEAKYTTNNGNNLIVGLWNGNGVAQNYPGSNSDSIGLWDNGGQWLGGTSGGTNPGQLHDGDIVSFDVDITNRIVKVSVNGGAYASTDTFSSLNGSGPFYIDASFNYLAQVDAAFNLSQFKYPIPQGCVAWEAPKGKLQYVNADSKVFTASPAVVSSGSVKSIASALIDGTSITSNARAVRQAIASLIDTVSLTTSIVRKAGIVAGLSNATNVAQNYYRTRGVASSLSNSTNVTSTIRHVVYASLANATNLTAASTRQRILRSNLANTTTLQTSLYRILRSNLSNTTALSGIPYRRVSSSLYNSTNLTTSIGRVVKSNLSNTTANSSTISRISKVYSSLSNSSYIVASEYKVLLSRLSGAGSLSATDIRSNIARSNLTNGTNVATTQTRIRGVASNLSNGTSVSTSIYRQIKSSLSNTTQFTAADIRIRRVASVLSNGTSVSTTINRVVRSALSNTTSVATNAQRVSIERSAQSNSTAITVAYYKGVNAALTNASNITTTDYRRRLVSSNQSNATSITTSLRKVVKASLQNGTAVGTYVSKLSTVTSNLSNASFIAASDVRLIVSQLNAAGSLTAASVRTNIARSALSNATNVSTTLTRVRRIASNQSNATAVSTAITRLVKASFANATAISTTTIRVRPVASSLINATAITTNVYRVLLSNLSNTTAVSSTSVRVRNVGSGLSNTTNISTQTAKLVRSSQTNSTAVATTAQRVRLVGSNLANSTNLATQDYRLESASLRNATNLTANSYKVSNRTAALSNSSFIAASDVRLIVSHLYNGSSLTASNIRIAGIRSSLSNSTNVSTSMNRIRWIASALSNSSNLSCPIVYRRVFSSLSNSTSVATAVTRVRLVSSSLANSTNLVTQNIKKIVTSSQSNATNVSATVTRIRLIKSTETNSTNIATSGISKLVSSTLTNGTSVGTTVNRVVKSSQSNATSLSTSTTYKTASAKSNLSNSSFIAASDVRLILSKLYNATSLSANTVRTNIARASLANATNVSTNVVRIRNVASALSNTTAFSSGTISKLEYSNLRNTTAINTTIAKLVSANLRNATNVATATAKQVKSTLANAAAINTNTIRIRPVASSLANASNVTVTNVYRLVKSSLSNSTTIATTTNRFRLVKSNLSNGTAISTTFNRLERSNLANSSNVSTNTSYKLGTVYSTLSANTVVALGSEYRLLFANLFNSSNVSASDYKRSLTYPQLSNGSNLSASDTRVRLISASLSNATNVVTTTRKIVGSSLANRSNVTATSVRVRMVSAAFSNRTNISTTINRLVTASLAQATAISTTLYRLVKASFSNATAITTNVVHQVRATLTNASNLTSTRQRTSFESANLSNASSISASDQKLVLSKLANSSNVSANAFKITLSSAGLANGSNATSTDVRIRLVKSNLSNSTTISTQIIHLVKASLSNSSAFTAADRRNSLVSAQLTNTTSNQTSYYKQVRSSLTNSTGMSTTTMKIVRSALANRTAFTAGSYKVSSRSASLSNASFIVASEQRLILAKLYAATTLVGTVNRYSISRANLSNSSSCTSADVRVRLISSSLVNSSALSTTVRKMVYSSLTNSSALTTQTYRGRYVSASLTDASTLSTNVRKQVFSAQSAMGSLTSSDQRVANVYASMSNSTATKTDSNFRIVRSSLASASGLTTNVNKLVYASLANRTSQSDSAYKSSKRSASLANASYCAASDQRLIVSKLTASGSISATVQRISISRSALATSSAMTDSSYRNARIFAGLANTSNFTALDYRRRLVSSSLQNSSSIHDSSYTVRNIRSTQANTTNLSGSDTRQRLVASALSNTSTFSASSHKNSLRYASLSNSSYAAASDQRLLVSHLTASGSLSTFIFDIRGAVANLSNTTSVTTSVVRQRLVSTSLSNASGASSGDIRQRLVSSRQNGSGSLAAARQRTSRVFSNLSNASFAAASDQRLLVSRQSAVGSMSTFAYKVSIESAALANRSAIQTNVLRLVRSSLVNSTALSTGNYTVRNVYSHVANASNLSAVDYRVKSVYAGLSNTSNAVVSRQRTSFSQSSLSNTAILVASEQRLVMAGLAANGSLTTTYHRENVAKASLANTTNATGVDYRVKSTAAQLSASGSISTQDAHVVYSAVQAQTDLATSVTRVRLVKSSLLNSTKVGSRLNRLVYGSLTDTTNINTTVSRVVTSSLSNTSTTQPGSFKVSTRSASLSAQGDAIGGEYRIKPAHSTLSASGAQTVAYFKVYNVGETYSNHTEIQSSLTRQRLVTSSLAVVSSATTFSYKNAIRYADLSADTSELSDDHKYTNKYVSGTFFQNASVVSATYLRTSFLASDLSNSSAIDTLAIRQRLVNSAIASSSMLTSGRLRVSLLYAQLSNATNTDTIITRISNVYAQSDAQTAIDVHTDRVRNVFGVMRSESDIEVETDRVSNVYSTLSADSDTDFFTGTRRYIFAELSGNSGELFGSVRDSLLFAKLSNSTDVAVDRLRTSFVGSEMAASLDASSTIERYANIFSDLVSETNLSTEVWRIKPTAADLSAQTDIPVGRVDSTFNAVADLAEDANATCESIRIRNVFADLSSASEVDTVISTIFASFAEMQTDGSVDTTIYPTRAVFSEQFNASSESVSEGLRVRLIASELACASNLEIDGLDFVGARTSMCNSTDTETTVTRVRNVTARMINWTAVKVTFVPFYNYTPGEVNFYLEGSDNIYELEGQESVVYLTGY